MAIIHPFKAWRPKADAVQQIACVPYDVINTDEAKELSKDGNQQFLHVIRPEIDLPEGTVFNDKSVYEKGRENLVELLRQDELIQEDEPSVYVYQLVMNGRSQTGLFTCVSVDDYDNDVILKHELTRPDKEDDRTRHITTQKAHAEPVMLTFKDVGEIGKIIKETQNLTPLYDFTADDGVEHRLWKCPESDALMTLFAGVDHLYVADGHHRCKSASRAAEELGGTDGVSDEVNYFPAVLFPMSEMEILAYNRVIHSVQSEQLTKILHTLNARPTDEKVPAEKGKICLYTRDGWYHCELPTSTFSEVSSQLDVARLSEYMLDPILNITDQRRDKNISFVGGIRGTKELEKLVDNGKADLAISMYPTSIEELVEVSDAGELMPPKSTWFEPKLRSGLLIHTFDEDL